MVYYIWKITQDTTLGTRIYHVTEGLNGREECSRASNIIYYLSMCPSVQYKTKLKDKNGCWQEGEEIHLINVNGQKYLRTDGNQIPEDNLGVIEERQS